MADQVLRLIVTGDVSSATASTKKLSRELTNLSDGMQRVGSNLTRYVTAPILAIGAASVKMAMDAVESENLFEVSMGKMATSARKWSEDISDSLGLNEYAVRKSVATFNVMLESMGLGEQAAFGMAKGLTQLSYDMASFYNLKPDEAFQKLQAGISGEIEPLKRLGIVINETTVKAYAYKTGIAEVGKELTEQQKVQARYQLIMEQTSKAQGDLARTAESPANKLRVLKERTTELGIELGMKLLPLFERAITLGLKLADSLETLNAEQQETAIKLGLVAAALGPVLMGLGQMIQLSTSLLGPVATLTGLTQGLYGAIAVLNAKMAEFTVSKMSNGLTGLFQKFGMSENAAEKLGKTIAWLQRGPLGITEFAISRALANITGKVNDLKRAAEAAAAAIRRLKAAGNFSTGGGSGGGGGGMGAYASGGIANGPTSGYPALLHGKEAVIPLSSRYRAQSLELMQQAASTLGIGMGSITIPISIDLGGQVVQKVITVNASEVRNGAYSARMGGA